MKFKIAKLYFKGPLALMDKKKDEFVKEVWKLPSDKLKGAMAYALDALGHKVEDFWDNVIVSSAFPFWDGEQTFYFFPKPMIKLPVKPSDNLQHAKNIKKIRFLEKMLFEKVINDEEFDLYEDAEFLEGKKFIAPPGILNGKTKVHLMKSQAEGKIALGNIYNVGSEAKPAPYFVSRTFFNPEKSGLYFLFEGDEEWVKKALDFFKGEGIGADKTYGNGELRDFKIDEMNLNIPEETNGHISLSKYIPAEDEIRTLLQSRFSIGKYGGFIAGARNENLRHWSKQTVWMIDEGAFLASTGKPNGKYVNVVDSESENALGHPVWREGRPFTIPVKIKNLDA